MKILLTGGLGMIGSVVAPLLRTRGHEVLAIDRIAGERCLQCDLQDLVQVERLVADSEPFDSIIHLAARAHDFRGLSFEDFRIANIVTTENLVAVLSEQCGITHLRFVQTSSINVYEVLQASSSSSRKVAEQEPYALSKLLAEKVLVDAGFKHLHILRIAPVYNEQYLADVKKRVLFPGTKIKLKLYPPPQHTFANLNRVVEAITKAVESKSTGVKIENIQDSKPISQHTMVSWFDGTGLPFPSVALSMPARLLMNIPGPFRKLGLGLRKFACSTSFPNPSLQALVELRAQNFI